MRLADMQEAAPMPQEPHDETASRPAVVLVGTFAAVGSRAVGEQLAVELSGRGWPVLLTSCKQGKLARLLDVVGTLWRRRREYAVAQVDVYSGRAFCLAEAACWTLRAAGKPYVLTLRGGNLPAFARRWPGRVRRLLASARAVTTPSRYLLEQMRSYRDSLCLLPNALDVRAYRFRLRSRPAPRLIWLRAFHHLYNPTLAVEVLARLSETCPQAELTMVGPDKGDGSRQAVEQLARRRGLAARVHLPGAVAKADVPGWLERADLFLNTTHVDNTPVSVLEAMACGLCVISTDVGGLPYLLRHEQDALLVPPDDAAAMTAAVRRVLDEPDLAERLSRGARAEAERFDWSAALEQWDQLLSNAAHSELVRLS